MIRKLHFCSENYQNLGWFEGTTVPLHHIHLLQRLRLEIWCKQPSLCFPHLNEDIDLTPYTNQEATLKGSSRCWYLFDSGYGEARDGTFDPFCIGQWSKWSLPRYHQNFVDLLNVQFCPIKWLKLVKKGRVFKVKQISMSWFQKPVWRQNHKPGKPAKPLRLLKNQLLSLLQNQLSSHQRKNEYENRSLYCSSSSSSERNPELPIQEAKKLNCFDDSWSWSLAWVLLLDSLVKQKDG